MAKHCYRCLTTKPLEEFYRHPNTKDGYLGKCKTCARADVNAYRANNPEIVRDRKRRYYTSTRGHAKKLNADARYNKIHPHKRSAYKKLMRAKKKGVIEQKPCTFCGSPNSEGHHHDYSKPLDVVWACHPCHMRNFHRSSK